jgi:hypothetical protein
MTSHHDRDYAVSTEARNAAYRLARDAGAQLITRPLFHGANLTTRDVEPAAGLRAARDLELAARRLALDYIRQAREAGHTWHDIGTALDLTPDPQAGHTAAEAAFDYAAGDRDTHHARTYGRSVTWTCTTCSQTIIDHGLETGPADDERGHLDTCERHAATIAASDTEWEASDAEWEAGE